MKILKNIIQNDKHDVKLKEDNLTIDLIKIIDDIY